MSRGQAANIMDIFAADNMKDVTSKFLEIQKLIRQFKKGKTIDAMTVAMKVAQLERMIHGKFSAASARYRQILEAAEPPFTPKQIERELKTFRNELQTGQGAIKKLNEVLFNLFKYIARPLGPVTRG
tara:strand:- start:1097 stop:1477 length:381 start_codon:yes stop_codon:yes gene_type:complete